jgi:Effector Associated Constant Component 1
MVAVIRVDGGDADELRSLHEWLRDEAELRGAVRLIHASVAPDELGGIADAVSVAVGAGGAGTVLASALATWLRTRRTAVRLVVQRGGQKVELELETLESVVPLIERLLDTGDDR